MWPKFVPVEGLEPLTTRLKAERSAKLSYTGGIYACCWSMRRLRCIYAPVASHSMTLWAPTARQWFDQQTVFLYVSPFGAPTIFPRGCFILHIATCSAPTVTGGGCPVARSIGNTME